MYRPFPVRSLPLLVLAATLLVLAATLLFLAATLPIVAQAPARQNSADAAIPAASSPPATAAAPTNLPPPTQEDIADSLRARRQYQAAIAAYAKIEHPSAVVWNKMGIAYQMMFNMKEAQRCYEKSLKLDRHNALVWNNLATIYDAAKDYKRAEKLYRKALKIDPKSALILKNLGTSYLQRHKYNKGWSAYEKAAALDPEIFHENNGPRMDTPTSLEQRGAMNYYMARGCLRSGQIGCTLQHLRMALSEGFTTAKKLASDADFKPLRDNAAFQELLAEQQQHP